MSAQGAKTLLRVSGAPKALQTCGLSTTSTQNGGESTIQPKRRSNMAKDGINLASMKKGTGYRSSFSGTVATVFGAQGMVGRGVCNRLGKSGSQMIIPYRGDFYETQRLKVCGDLGQVLFSPYHLKDEESIRKAMKYSDVVINLIGREHETLNFKFKDVNVTGPATLARIAREMGVKRFIHISSINAKENPDSLFLPGGSNWLRTKWQGEQAVLQEFPDATIFRPCEMYGHGDHFTAYYNTPMRMALSKRHMAFWNKGESTVRSPLWVQDLTTGIMNALDDPSTKGMTIEAMGPERFLQADLIDWMHEVMYKDPYLYEWRRLNMLFSPVTIGKAIAMSFLPIGNKWMRSPTLERLERSQLTEKSEGLPGLEDIGVKLHTVTDKMVFELEFYQAFQYHEFTREADRPVINPLHPITDIEEKALEAKNQQGKNILKAIGV